MTNQIIIIIALFFIYFHISGLATTNILRLTAGNTVPVLSSKCKCDQCGYKIPAFLQLPIISYIICKGKCKKCGTKIPVFALLLEIIVLTGMCLISSVFHFSPIGIAFSFLFYEVIRIITISLKGKRASHFAKQYFIAVVSMIPFIFFSLFVSLLYTVV